MPAETLPEAVLIDGDPFPENVAARIKSTSEMGVARLDQLRRELCSRVVAAHRGETRRRFFSDTTEALQRVLRSRPERQNLSKVAVLFLDRRAPLFTLAQDAKTPSLKALPARNQKGRLSVVVTCYEMGPPIREAVESVWASDRQPEEVLIIDDGSYGEATLASIRTLENDASQRGLALRVIRQQNRGLAAARNAGLEHASGEFISFLDGDDLVEPLFYRLALQLLEEHPRVGGIAAWAFIFGDDVPDGFWCAPQPELPFLFTENSVVVPCLTRTQLLRDLGGYDMRQRYNYEDWELGIRMLASGWPIVTIPMHLVRYRVRTDSLLRSMTDVQNQVMRELMLTTHRETVSKFAVEINMQSESRPAKVASSSDISAANRDHRNACSRRNGRACVTSQIAKRFQFSILEPIKRFFQRAQGDFISRLTGSNSGPMI